MKQIFKKVAVEEKRDLAVLNNVDTIYRNINGITRMILRDKYKETILI